MKPSIKIFLPIPLALIVAFFYLISPQYDIPNIEEEWWGSEDEKVDTSIKQFKIEWSDEAIQDLKHRLNNSREPVPPLEGAAWIYGINGTYLKNIVLPYWLNEYNFKARLAFLNQFPQFTTNIQGLNIHFFHVKPSNAEGKRVLPLLILHGWPGSVVEFQKVIPLLTKPQENRDFVFEIVTPALPGFGYSQATTKVGLNSAHIGGIMKNLMIRLGHDKFYIQGGDWGAIIGAQMSTLWPEHTMGLHSAMCIATSPRTELKKALYSFWPSLLVSEEDHELIYPLAKRYPEKFQITGYLHIQATKPDTLGACIADSPVALAAYILEKFSDATKHKNDEKEDGGLFETFTPDELIDNLMLYWMPNKMTTAMRIYAESFNKKFDAWSMQWPIDVPSACAQFPHEIIWIPESFLRERFRNLLQITRMPRGGHFSLFEEPELAANDIWNFIEKVEALSWTADTATKTDL